MSSASDAENLDLDLRAGQHKMELGRSPRDEPLSVNKYNSRYKKAQAQKFSEHTPETEAPYADALPTEAGANPVSHDTAVPVAPVTFDDADPMHEVFSDMWPKLKTPLSNVKAKTQAVLPSSENSADDNSPSQAREPRGTQERQHQLQHNRTSIASSTSVRHKPDYTGGTTYTQAEGSPTPAKQVGRDFIADTLKASALGNDPPSKLTHDIAPPAGLEPPTVVELSYVDSVYDAPSDSGKDTANSNTGSDIPKDERPTSESSNAEHDRPANESGSDSTPKADKNLEKALNKAQHKAERSAEKLQRAQDNLPKKLKLHIDKEFDPEKGKMKPRLRFEEEVKTQSEHVKGPLLTRPIKTAANIAIGYAHTKVFQVQEENVGVKAAHKGELLAEGGLRYAYHRYKTAPYRKVEKLKAKTAKLNINAAYRKALRDNPELASSPLSRMLQKRRIKREYAAAAREAGRGGNLITRGAMKLKDAAVKIVTKSAATLASPKVLFTVGSLALVAILLFGLVSACSGMASGLGQSIAAMSYLAEAEDIDDAALYYSEMETDLLMQIANIEADWPGFDEYRLAVDLIGHDPFVLIAYLTAVHHDFTFEGIQAVLREIFAEQYNLTIAPEVEIRTRTETRTGSFIDGAGNVQTYTYTVEVDYEWHVLNVTLTSRSLSQVINSRMTSEQRQHHALLMRSRGLRQIVASPFDFNWQPFISSHYGWRVHPINGGKDRHLGVDIAVSTGTPILAAHGGTVTFVGNMGGYGLVVFINDGNGLETRYAHCNTVLVNVGQTVEAGDVIATVGSTGDSTGPHLHFEIIRNGRHLNPLFFAHTNSVPFADSGEPVFGDPGAPMGDGSFEAVFAEATRLMGAPYVFGASGPNAFDCSGFVYWVLTRSGAASVGRTSSQGFYNMSRPVHPSEAQPGDLVFFHSTFSSPNFITHVGIYLGNGQMFHTGSNPNGVEIVNINTPRWQSHLHGWGRL